MLVALGAFYRVAIIAFWCLFTYAELMDVTTYLNHYYFVSLQALILCFLSPHRAWSVDAGRRPGLAATTLPAWQTWWLRFQVGVLYLYAGLAKIESDWLFHAQPLNLWLPTPSGMPIIGPLLGQPWVHFAFSWFAFLFDTSIIAFMLWKQDAAVRVLRDPGVPLLHAPVLQHRPVPVHHGVRGADLLRARLAAHGWRDVDARCRHGRRVHSFRGASSARDRWVPVVRRFAGRRLTVRCRMHGRCGGAFALDRWQATTALVVLRVLPVQFLMPLRHWAYPGTVLWHEQGMRFSWRVMLREKSGALDYRVVDATGTRCSSVRTAT